MTKENVKNILKSNGLYQWQLADEIGISEVTFCRWMRYKLEGERLTRLENAVASLLEKKRAGDLL